MKIIQDDDICLFDFNQEVITQGREIDLHGPVIDLYDLSFVICQGAADHPYLVIYIDIGFFQFDILVFLQEFPDGLDLQEVDDGPEGAAEVR